MNVFATAATEVKTHSKAACCLVSWVALAAVAAAGESGIEHRKLDRERQVLPHLLAGRGSDGEEALQEEICEVLASLKNRQEPPVAARHDFFEVPIAFAARLRSGIGHGTSEARNLQDPRGTDLSRVDPLPSSFWRRPIGLADLDLRQGFGRSEAESLALMIWDYAGPKRGSGLNPGFHAMAGGLRIRVKFAETKSEPFAARMFWALGYNVDPTHYCRGLKVRYDRRLLEEFNSRDEVSTQFTFAGLLRLYTLRMQRRYDPFDYVAWAVMRDGRRLEGPTLKRELLLGADASSGRLRFRPEVEARIDFLVTVPANVQLRDRPGKTVGPWQFEGLGHEDLRELRGAGLLAAWIGWNDCRKQNTRLRVVRQGGSPRLIHYFSDLGGGLGKANGIFSGKGELPDEFSWTFTAPPVFQGRGRMMIPFRITGYRPMEHNEAFERMTVADARWMARLIGQLTERQIVEALEASGFDSWELRLYTEKLMRRRDRMICDLGLDKEFRLSRPQHAMKGTKKHGTESEPAEVTRSQRAEGAFVSKGAKDARP